MQADAPAPLTPADADLTDFAFMPLQVARLRRSKAWLKCKRRPELAFYMINLWTAAWHDKPAGSLEDDDDVLADLAMCDPARWDELRADVLHGWIKASDGRLYHPTVAEQVRGAWDAKLDQRWRTECARIKKHAERHDIALPRPTFEQWVAGGCKAGHRLPMPSDVAGLSLGTNAQSGRDIPNAGAAVACESSNVTDETQSKGQGEGQGEREGQRQGEGQGQPVIGAPPPPSPTRLPPAAEAAAKRGTRIPPDWKLQRTWGEWALAKYPHWTEAIVRDLALSFHNHWKGKSGKDAAKLDWYATWQNWCMSDIAQRQYPPPRRGADAPPGETPEERKQRRLAEGLAAMQGTGARAAAIPATTAVIDA